jgi:pimeloyl-ACP methyl ester carboxylesterase
LTQGEFSRLVLDPGHTVFKVPMFFLSGRYDHQSEAFLAHRYFEHISAPRKEFIWFEDSAHSPNFEESVKFNETVIRQLHDVN